MIAPPPQSSVFMGYLYVNWLGFYVSVFMLNIRELLTGVKILECYGGQKLQADC